MKSLKDLLPYRIHINTRMIRLHRPITAILLTVTGLVIFGYLLIENCFHLYNLEKDTTNNTTEYYSCNQDSRKWIIGFIFFFEATNVYLPYFFFCVGADKHPFKKLEDFQRLSQYKVHSIGHLTHIILEQMNKFIEHYRRSDQKMLRKIRMLCLFYQEITQFVIFIINFFFINIIFNNILVNCSKHGFQNINSAGEVNRNITSWMLSNPVLNILVPLIWFWYLILFIITLLYIVYRLTTYAFHRNKTFNKLYWQIDDDNLVSILGRFDFGEWLFLDYVRKTTLRFVYKSILKHFEDYPETTNNTEDGKEKNKPAVIYFYRVQDGQKLNVTCSVCVSEKLAKNEIKK